MPVIQCTDADGANWEVFEVERLTNQREAVRARLADGWLCFQRADGHKVRVARGDYPENWATIPAAELLALTARGLPAQPALFSTKHRD
jgi:hypothetical protein